MAYISFRGRFSKSRQIATFMKRAIEEESITSDGKAAIDDGKGEKVSVASTGGLDSASTISLITSTATSISDVRTISLDSSEVLTLIDSSYVQARIGAVGGGDVEYVGTNLYTSDNQPPSLTGDYNFNLGTGSGDALTTGSFNTSLGYNNFTDLTTGNYNIAIGANIGGGSTGSSGNVVIGYHSGTNVYGTYNTIIGYNTGDGATNNAHYNILIGYNAETTSSTSDNQCILGARSGTGMISYLQVGSYMTMNSGTLTMSGNVTAYSDARLKTNVETVKGLDKVTQMRGVTFEKDGQQGTGVIAQEMLEVAPELVHEEHDYYSVNYSGLSGYFIEAIKEQQKQIEELKAEIKKLKGE